MKEKQKTCITIQKAAISNPGMFTEMINIPHNVNVIRCKTIGFIIYDGVTAQLIDDAFYITTNLISNIHDNILGFGPNLNTNFPTSEKTFYFNQNIVSGIYTFNIHYVSNGLLNIDTGGTSVVIDLEFIELE